MLPAVHHPREHLIHLHRGLLSVDQEQRSPSGRVLAAVNLSARDVRRWYCRHAQVRKRRSKQLSRAERIQRRLLSLERLLGSHQHMQIEWRVDAVSLWLCDFYGAPCAHNRLRTGRTIHGDNAHTRLGIGGHRRDEHAQRPVILLS